MTLTASTTELISNASGTYSAVANQCAPATKYYYKAFMVVWNPGTHVYDTIESDVIKSFTTTESSPVSISLPELPSYGSGDKVVTMYRTGETSGTDANRNYTFNYSTTYYSALWVAYPLTYADTQGNASHSGNWAYNTASGISSNYQVNVTSNSYGVNYGDDTYSRGHQIPNADRKSDQTALDQTYLVTNQTPQMQDQFNASVWSTLEGKVRGLLSSSRPSETVYVITGPVYQTVGGNEEITYLNATSSTIKPSRVPVPNYYWKVLLKVKTNSSGAIVGASTIGFWYAHKPYGLTKGPDFTTFIMSVNDIEKKTGFNLFANLPDEYEDTVEENTNWTAFESFNR